MDKWTFPCESIGLMRHMCVQDLSPRLLLILRLHLAISQLASTLPAWVFLLQPSEGALLITVWLTFSLPLTVFKVSCTLCTFNLRLPSREPSQYPYPSMLSFKSGWTLEVLPSCFQGEPLAVLPNTLVPALCPVPAYIWRRWNTKVAWLFLPSYSHFISRCVSSCSRLFRLRCLPSFPPSVVSRS